MSLLLKYSSLIPTFKQQLVVFRGFGCTCPLFFHACLGFQFAFSLRDQGNAGFVSVTRVFLLSSVTFTILLFLLLFMGFFVVQFSLFDLYGFFLSPQLFLKRVFLEEYLPL